MKFGIAVGYKVYSAIEIATSRLIFRLEDDCVHFELLDEFARCRVLSKVLFHGT